MEYKKIYILNIDDMSYYVSLIKSHLDHMKVDFELDHVISMEEASKKLKEKYKKEGFYNLIISDLNIPGGKSGIDMVKAIRSSKSIKDLPFILITSETSNSKVMEAIEAGIDAFIPKPWTFEQFSGAVTSAFMNRGHSYKKKID